jgi:hypothetical protein
MTPEDEEFNRIEMESRIRQEGVRSISQHTWVGLTDYEIGVCSTEAAMNKNDMVGGAVTFAKAIEAKLKEKNT